VPVSDGVPTVGTDISGCISTIVDGSGVVTKIKISN
jgi:hypothetical protein